MERNAMWALAPALLLALLGAGCGSEPEAAPEPPRRAQWGEAQPEGADAAHAEGPGIESLRIEPAEPAPGDRVRAVSRVFHPAGRPMSLRHEWRVDGRIVGDEGMELELRDVGRGARVEVRVVASDGASESEARTAATRVRNRRPVVVDLDVEPFGEVPHGTPISLRAQGRDPDGDPIEFEFRWSVNGEPVHAREATFETVHLERGDVVQAEVWASDGIDRGPAVKSAPVRVTNAHPVVRSMPAGLSESGSFHYRMLAEDPEGTNVRYALRRGPPGMAMDADSGEVRWQAGPEHGGVHAVELVAEDAEGGRTIQSFELVVGASEPGPPASPSP